MGNFEKLVVLLVLLASAGALAVSLNNSETPSDAPSKPGEAREGLDANAELGTKPAVQRPSTGAHPSKPSAAKSEPRKGLATLDAGFQPAKKQAVSNQPNKNGMPYILVNTQGLKPSFMPDEYMTFEPSAGDTWMSLAKEFYGNQIHASNLKLANEGIQKPSDVSMLMIPMYDFTLERSDRPAFEPAPELARDAYRAPYNSANSANSANTARDTTPSTNSSEPRSTPLNPEGGISYEVIQGDSLSLISQKVYGKASRWREIFAANRDKLAHEDALKLGMKLYIPKAGEYKAASTKSLTGVH